jgi:hypothetical protein
MIYNRAHETFQTVVFRKNGKSFPRQKNGNRNQISSYTELQSLSQRISLLDSLTVHLLEDTLGIIWENRVYIGDWHTALYKRRHACKAHKLFRRTHHHSRSSICFSSDLKQTASLLKRLYGTSFSSVTLTAVMFHKCCTSVHLWG